MTDQNPLDQQRTLEKQKENSKSFNIFTASYREVFVKNFLAGLGRALGAIIVYLIIFSGLFYFASQTLIPMLQNLIQNSPLNPSNQIQQLLPQLTK